MNDVEFEFNFSDLTMLEADGDFQQVKEIMKSGMPVTSKYHDLALSGWVPSSDDWMLVSGLTIDSIYGLAQMTVHLYSNGRIIITNYNPSVGDVYYNPDIQALSEWSQQNGWNAPEPSEELVKENLDFWRHYWDTLLVDSPYLDDVFGKRPQLESE